jgi:hypothetical protein
VDITTIIIVFVIGWVLIQIMLGVTDAMQVVKLKERVEVLKHLNDIIHQVKIEKIEDIEYWYDDDDKEFLGQGKTIEEIANHLKSRYPDHIFIIKDQGGISKHTEWKFMPTDQFSKINLTVKDL